MSSIAVAQIFLHDHMSNQKKVGLALGSGGIRGLAHIGVLKVLIENNIPIDYISGSSIGAWVGAMYAINRDLALVETRALEYRWDKFLALMEPTLKGGVVKGQKVEKLLRLWMKDITFEELEIPVSVMTTDLVSGKEYIFDSGPVAPAVRASIAIPLVFQPVKHQDKLLLDGGLLHPLPIAAAQNMGADVVIGVNVDLIDSFEFDATTEMSLRATAVRSFHLMYQRVYDTSGERADITIEPIIPIQPITAWRKYFQQKNLDDIVELGEAATREKIPEIKKLLGVE